MFQKAEEGVKELIPASRNQYKFFTSPHCKNLFLTSYYMKFKILLDKQKNLTLNFSDNQWRTNSPLRAYTNIFMSLKYISTHHCLAMFYQLNVLFPFQKVAFGYQVSVVSPCANYSLNLSTTLLTFQMSQNNKMTKIFSDKRPAIWKVKVMTNVHF